MTEWKSKSFSGITAGLLLMALGTVWLLNSLNLVDLPIRQWWPSILIVIGLVKMANRRCPGDLSGWILILLGSVFLLTANDIMEWKDILKFWPVLLILVGLSFLFSRRGARNKHKYTARCEAASDSDFDSEKVAPEHLNDDYLQGNAIFGGIKRKIENQDFKGGSLSALFGGIEIDLNSAGLAPEGAVLNLSIVFGGAEIRIPESWNIEVRPSVTLGGIEKKTANRDTQEGQRLIINTSVVLGGIEIKN